ncbi:ClC family H(+)/Cl(-) exchange transporter [Olsenella phocaeensis]|uniref:ClC family H(+)/Cl(-) exchange transporter n=1 Tax=Olsenella phocaeensis TaxID=1852385 RepID=UPI003A8E4872
MFADTMQGEVRRRFSRRFQIDMVWEGALVGIAGGGVVTLYRMALTRAEHILRGLLPTFFSSGLGLLGFAALVLACCLVVAALVRWEPYTSGSGIPQTDAEVMGRMDMPWHRVLLAKFSEGVLCALAGLSMGREGPSVQLGSMGGKAVSRLLRRNRGEERLLVTCGAAAGMSAAFNAPLTGVLFAIEEIHKEFAPSLIVSAMASAVASDFLVSQVLGVQPVLKLAFIKDIPHDYYLYVVALGVLCGLAGAVHNRGMFACTERLFAKMGELPLQLRLAIPFALAIPVAYAMPELLCGGDAIVELLSAPAAVPLGTLALLLLGKYLYTTVCFGAGTPGGTLFPLCVMGMLCGAVFAACLTRVTGVQSLFMANFMALGIAGLFASVVRAPVTAVVLAFELTGSMDALLSVSIVSIVSYVVANLTKTDPFYERLLSRLLDLTPVDPSANGEPGEKVLHTYTVGAGSKLEGRTLSEVGWPDDSRIVTVSRAGVDIVPSGETTLEALDEILVIMNTDTEVETQALILDFCRSSLATGKVPRVG